MRRSFVFLSIFCCCNFFLQSQDKGSFASQLDSLRNFHPLQIGNRWIYLHSEGILSNLSPTTFTTRDIVGDTLINGRYYSVFFETKKNTGGKGYEYLRWDSMNANIYTLYGTSGEQLYDSLLCTNGSNPSLGLSFVSLKSDTVFGMTLPSRTVSYWPNIDNVESYKFVYGVGLVSFGTENFMGAVTNDDVAYANIAGKEYGINVLKKIIDSLALYYPMHLGDEWTYRRISSSSIRTDTVFTHANVIGDTLVANVYYRVFRQTDLSNNATTTYYARFDSSTGDLLKNDTVEDNAFVNSNYALFENESLQFNGTTIASILGLNTTKRSLLVWMNPGWYGRRDYAWGLGLVYSSYQRTTDSLETNELVYAKITNKEYGITAVQEVNNTLPSSFRLFQNYPIPFNPSTTFSFDLPNRIFVSLNVFDLLGRNVSIIVFEELSAGKHTVQWNARDLPSGVYFYRLQAGSFDDTKKLLLLR